jgi:tetratricopeptide (TPR) repeat protein
VEERAGNLPAAALQYRKVLEVNDQNVVALNNLAFLLTDLGPRVDEALTLAQKASELAPESAYVQDTLGWVLYRKGLYPSAIQYLEKAVSKEPTDRRKCHLALAYLKSGNQQRGREMLAAAVKMSPELLKESFLQDFLAEAGPQRN